VNVDIHISWTCGLQNLTYRGCRTDDNSLETSMSK
jgi:hypothetical protein